MPQVQEKCKIFFSDDVLFISACKMEFMISDKFSWVGYALLDIKTNIDLRQESMKRNFTRGEKVLGAKFEKSVFKSHFLWL